MEQKVVSWTETWYRMPCPECSEINWHCAGNLEDITGIDADAIKCHACKKVFFLADPEDMMLDEDPNEWYIEDGAASPIGD